MKYRASIPLALTLISLLQGIPAETEFDLGFALHSNLCFGGLITGLINPIIPRRDASEVTFNLYTKPDYPDEYTRISYNNVDRIVDRFIAGAPVKILIHGFRNAFDTPGGFSVTVREAYQRWQRLTGNDLNIILVDWSKYSRVRTLSVSVVGREGNPSANYQFAARSTKMVANEIATLISNLVTLDLVKPEQIHIVGHSLGGQVAGFTGRFTASLLKGKKIGRISALDPAGPCFNKPVDEKLNKDDAEFTDVIHTDGGTFYLGNQIGQLGNLEMMGHADFYPNGGREQEGCTWTFNFGCSHGIVSKYFAESIWSNKTSFTARKCESWPLFKRDQCEEPPEYAQMGEPCDHKARGAYYLKTSKASPFALGDKGTYENKPRRLQQFLGSIGSIIDSGRRGVNRLSSFSPIKFRSNFLNL